MIQGLYGAASALDAAGMNQDLVAENLANANTPGFRRHGLVFEEVAAATPGAAPSTRNSRGTRVNRPFTAFESGPLQQTGNPFDLSLSANTFFVLDGPDAPLYTRNGAFERNDQGVLQNRAGIPVRGQGGPITIPTTASEIQITPDGVVLADRSEVGRLQLAQFDDPDVLQRAGTSFFTGPQGRQPEPGTYRVEQGSREGSNVQVVNEMVNMMIGMRYYEAAQRALRVLGDAVALNTRPQG